MNEIDATRRNDYQDNIKFALIYLVVAGHLIEHIHYHGLVQGIYSALYRFIYSFHMPMFVMISGYYSKEDRSISYIKHNIIRILIPYIISQIAFWSFYHFFVPNFEKPFNIFDPVTIMWYLFSLFIWRLILPYIAQFKYLLIISLIIALLVGFLPFINYKYSLSRIIVFFPFFILGHNIRKNGYERFRIKRNIALFVILVALLASVLLRKQSVALLYCQSPYISLGVPMWTAFILRLAFFLMATLIGVSILRLIPQRKYFFTMMGQNTLYVYLLHMYIVKSLFLAGGLLKFHNIAMVPVIFIAGLLIVWVLSSNTVKSIFKYAIEPDSAMFKKATI